MFSSNLKAGIAALAFLLLVASPAPALLRKRISPAVPAPVGNPYVHGGIIPKYGYDPRTAPNPYPWHAPAMNSGFRHYHLLPPLAPEGVPPGVPVPPLAEDSRIEELPKPRNLR